MKKTILIPGFQFAGIHAGIKDDPKKKDLTLIYSEASDTLVDGVFTTNRVCAAPVVLCREVIRRKKARLIVINSGVANACTGKRGYEDALKTQSEAARLFRLKNSEVLVSSTGKIGNYLPMRVVLKGLKKAKEALSPRGFMEATRGIMTTDEFPKFASTTGEIGRKKYTIAVLAKGAGMLRPDMATMLAYVLTDLRFDPQTLKKLFRQEVEQTLNRITVDGDTSTNDTVLVMANGKAGNKPFTADSPQGKQVARQFQNLLEEMAKKIALDGEGATKCCLVRVKGAASHADAKKIAYAIGNSPLVKTALFGCDPNWGRVMAAVGYSGAKIIPEKVNIKMGDLWLVKKGRGAGFNPAAASKYLKRQHIQMEVQVGSGPGSFHVYMSDLTYDYIHLNAEYHT